MGNFRMEIGEIVIERAADRSSGSDSNNVTIYAIVALLIVIVVAIVTIIVVVILVYRWRLKKKIRDMRSMFEGPLQLSLIGLCLLTLLITYFLWHF